MCSGVGICSPIRRGLKPNGQPNWTAASTALKLNWDAEVVLEPGARMLGMFPVNIKDALMGVALAVKLAANRVKATSKPFFILSPPMRVCCKKAFTV